MRRSLQPGVVASKATCGLSQTRRAQGRAASRSGRGSPTDQAVFHFVDRVEDIQGSVIMRNDDHSSSVPMGHVPEQLHYLPATDTIECCRGLVREDEARLVGKCARDRYPLLLAPGELRRSMRGARADSQSVQ